MTLDDWNASDGCYSVLATLEAIGDPLLKTLPKGFKIQLERDRLR